MRIMLTEDWVEIPDGSRLTFELDRNVTFDDR